MASTKTRSFNGTVHLALDTFKRGKIVVKDTVFIDPALPLLAPVIEAANEDNRADYNDVSREKMEVLMSALTEAASRKRDFYAKQGIRSALASLKGMVAYKEKAGNGARIRLSAVVTGHSRHNS
jgi:hypothetical protein